MKANESATTNRLRFFIVRTTSIRVPFALACMLWLASLPVAAQQVITVIGGGSGDGGPADQAIIIGARGLVRDSNGNIFVAESDRSRIRRIDASSGVITTFAGDGTRRITGDGGPAALASLNIPVAVAVDAAGNLYIGDENDDRIRKISAGTGTVSSIAGVVGRLASDASGNLFVAEYLNNRIRRIDALTGVISTVAGNGAPAYAGDGTPATSASLNGPADVVVRANGDLYIADRNNNRVRKVNAATGTISTVAGDGTPASAGDGGAATVASLLGPLSISLDALGNIYVVEKDRVRKISAASGLISTVAGDGEAGYAGDGGPATAAKLNAPNGVLADGSGNLLIADGSNYRIRRVDEATGVIETVAGNGKFNIVAENVSALAAAIAAPRGVAIATNGDIYFSAENRVLKRTAATGLVNLVAGFDDLGFGSLGDGGPALTARLGYPEAMDFDSAGNLYVADSLNQRIRKIAAGTGIISTVVGNGMVNPPGDGGPATAASLYAPTSVHFDPADNMYIAEAGGNRVRKVDAGSSVIHTIAGTGSAGFSGDGGNAASALLNNPTFAATDANGNVYIADRDNHRIRKLDLSGNISTFAGNGNAGYGGDGGLATAATLNMPASIAIDAAGSVYVADTFNHRIRKVKPNGTIATVAGNAIAAYSLDGDALTTSLLGPHHIYLDATGRNLYFTDSGTLRVRKLTIPAFSLSVSKTGSGAGTVASIQSAISCGATCSASLLVDSEITLVATPAAGSLFAGWSGGSCIGRGVCQVGLVADTSVIATFTLPGAPDAPTITHAIPASEQAIIRFAPPVFDGGSPITGYAATCNPDAIAGSGASSPVTVAGLTNDVTYSCSVAAINAIGTGQASAAFFVTPTAMPPLVLFAVQSRKRHGPAGSFDVSIDFSKPLTGAVTIEPRSGMHTLVFQFNADVTSVGNYSALYGTGATINLLPPTISGNEVLVNLSGIGNGNRVRVSLGNLNSGGFNVAASLGFLIGDVTGSRSVNSGDISAIKAQSGRLISNLNFSRDLDLSGTLDAADVSFAKSRSGLTMP